MAAAWGELMIASVTRAMSREAAIEPPGSSITWVRRDLAGDRRRHRYGRSNSTTMDQASLTGAPAPNGPSTRRRRSSITWVPARPWLSGTPWGTRPGGAVRRWSSPIRAWPHRSSTTTSTYHPDLARLRQQLGFSDHIVNITLYWLTNIIFVSQAVSESKGAFFSPKA